MTYPSATEVEWAAAQLGVSKLASYAFSALNARLPMTRAEVDALIVRAEDFRVAIGRGNTDEILGFVQARGTWPWAYQAYEDFAIDAGIWTVDRRWTGRIAYPGLGYPPGSPLVVTPPAPVDGEPEAPPNIWAWVQTHMIETGLIAAAVWFFVLKERR